ncbi:MAG: hypothetical protein RIC35_03110 [Marinoscillum sp.]
MIYLWHNTQHGNYEMGNERDFHLANLLSEVTIVHEFDGDEVRIAEKILINLNRAVGEMAPA